MSTNVAKYPEGLLDVIEAICETRKPCEIVYVSTKVAKKERFKFYGLIKALFVSGHSLGMTATRIKISLFGADPKNPNILRLTLPDADENDRFYKAIAEKHLKDNQK